MITRELIKKIRKIDIYTNRLVNHQLAGAYHSVFKGRGMAFDEVRKYQPGDEIRLIDWNVSARMDDVFVKVFVEEREMTVMLLVDMSASGLFGTQEQTKREIVAELAAIMAFSAIKNNDRVGLIIFTDQVEKFLPPKKGKKHVLRVISEILSFEPQHTGTEISAALEFLGRVASRHSVAFLFSDFISQTNAEQDASAAFQGIPDRLERALRVVRSKHDLIPITVTDPLEQELPSLGLLNLIDFESGQEICFDSSGPEAKAYAVLMRRMREAREGLFRRLKIDFIDVRTDRPYLKPLVNFFRKRERRMSR